MQIQLSDHFNYGKLLRFTLPTIVMMIFTSIYSIVDGFFISNFVGITLFAAISFLRTLLFQIASVLILPVFFQLDGVWYSLFVVEILAMIVTFAFYVIKRKDYHYC